MKIIDFHTHNFPATLAPRALSVMCEKLAERGHRDLLPHGDGTIATQLRDMDKAGVWGCVNCPVATRIKDFDPIFKRALAIRDGKESAEMANRSIQFASIHPLDPDFRSRINQLKNEGIKGIKLHPFYMQVSLDDPNTFPFFEALRDAGIIVISHSGYDPGYDNNPPRASPKQIATLLKNVAGLKFVAAHVGGECGSEAHATDSLLPFENCYIDTAVMYFRRDAEESQRIIRSWPVERMLFATDYFWEDEARLINWIKFLRPNINDQEMIFHANAERLLNCVTNS